MTNKEIFESLYPLLLEDYRKTKNFYISEEHLWKHLELIFNTIKEEEGQCTHLVNYMGVEHLFLSFNIPSDMNPYWREYSYWRKYNNPERVAFEDYCRKHNFIELVNWNIQSLMLTLLDIEDIEEDFWNYYSIRDNDPVSALLLLENMRLKAPFNEYAKELYSILRDHEKKYLKFEKRHKAHLFYKNLNNKIKYIIWRWRIKNGK